MQQEKYIDLHTHSTFSDGTNTPTRLVEIAMVKGLTALALTDHDSLDGFVELADAADAVGLEVITGVEMSCEHNSRDLHILGYGVDHEATGLQNMLKMFRDARRQRGVDMIARLRELDVNITEEAVMVKVGRGALGRPHIAQVLLDEGYVSYFGEAFDKYIGEGAPAYVDKYKMDPVEAVGHIHAAGGLAFVAHPGYYIDGDVDAVDSFDDLLDKGFDGIEVLHPHHNAEMVRRLTEIATSRDMLMSGGSDYHGIAGRDNLGISNVPYEILEKMKDRLHLAN